MVCVVSRQGARPSIPLAPCHGYCCAQVRVWRGVVEGLNTTFLEPENGHFWRGCIYGRNDDAAR